MSSSIYILGAGGMAKEVFDIYSHLGKSDYIKGFIEENSERSGEFIFGKRIFSSSIFENLLFDILLIGGIGSPLRKRFIQDLSNQGYDFDTIIHPSAIIGQYTSIKTGSIICPGVIITCDIHIGFHTIINNNSSISHDCKIGNFVTIAPGTKIGGKVNIGDGTCIGIGSTISDRIKIGENSFIGAGSVVVKDIPDNVLAFGVPAKPRYLLEEDDWIGLI